MPETLSPHATWAYSWSRPPSLSRRMTLTSASTGSGSARSGLAWFSARCGRCLLKWDSYSDRTLRRCAARGPRSGLTSHFPPATQRAFPRSAARDIPRRRLVPPGAVPPGPYRGCWRIAAHLAEPGSGGVGGGKEPVFTTLPLTHGPPAELDLRALRPPDRARSRAGARLLKDIDRPGNHQSQDHERADRLHSHGQFAPAGEGHYIGRAERSGVGKAEVKVVEEFRAPAPRSYLRVELLGKARSGNSGGARKRDSGPPPSRTQ